MNRCKDCLHDIRPEDPRFEATRNYSGQFIPVGSGDKLCVDCGQHKTDGFQLMVPERRETSKGEVFYIETFPDKIPTRPVRNMMARAERNGATIKW